MNSAFPAGMIVKKEIDALAYFDTFTLEYT